MGARRVESERRRFGGGERRRRRRRRRRRLQKESRPPRGAPTRSTHITRSITHTIPASTPDTDCREPRANRKKKKHQQQQNQHPQPTMAAPLLQKERVLELLRQAEVEHEVYEHAEVATADAQVRGCGRGRDRPLLLLLLSLSLTRATTTCRSNQSQHTGPGPRARRGRHGHEEPVLEGEGGSSGSRAVRDGRRHATLNSPAPPPRNTFLNSTHTQTGQEAAAHPRDHAGRRQGRAEGCVILA